MTDVDFIAETDHFSDVASLAPRPFCPKCEMRMITVHNPHPAATYECLRCGHTELKRR